MPFLTVSIVLNSVFPVWAQKSDCQFCFRRSALCRAYRACSTIDFEFSTRVEEVGTEIAWWDSGTDEAIRFSERSQRQFGFFGVSLHLLPIPRYPLPPTWKFELLPAQSSHSELAGGGATPQPVWLHHLAWPLVTPWESRKNSQNRGSTFFARVFLEDFFPLALYLIYDTLLDTQIFCNSSGTLKGRSLCLRARIENLSFTPSLFVALFWRPLFAGTLNESYSSR